MTGVTNGQDAVFFGAPDRPLDPLLGPLQDNGGPTPTFAPRPGSLALDGGSGSADPGTDQRGATRGTVIDIGAYQATASRLNVFFPSPTAAGQTQLFAVNAVDSFGQPSYDDRDALTFASGDARAILPASGSLDLGFGTFSATLKTAGSQTLTVTDSGAGLSATQANVIVQAGAAAAGSVVSGNSQSAVVTSAFGTPLEVRVTDAFGNAVAGASVTFSAITGSRARPRRSSEDFRRPPRSPIRRASPRRRSWPPEPSREPSRSRRRRTPTPWASRRSP